MCPVFSNYEQLYYECSETFLCITICNFIVCGLCQTFPKWIYRFILLPAVYERSLFSTISPTVAVHHFCQTDVIVLICSALIINEVEHFFKNVLAIWFPLWIVFFKAFCTVFCQVFYVLKIWALWQISSVCLEYFSLPR